MLTQRFLRDQFHAYRLWILERSRPADAAAAWAPPSGLDLVVLDRHARRDWVAQRSDDADWTQYRTALENEHDLVLAQRAGVTVGWAWIGYGRVYLPPLGRELRLAHGSGYLYDAYVKPAERRTGIGKALVGARCALADERGVERLVSHVLVNNVASLHALHAHGFTDAGRTVFLRALALRVWVREPLPAPHAA